MTEAPMFAVVMLEDYSSSGVRKKDKDGKPVPQYLKGQKYSVDWAAYRCLVDHLRVAKAAEDKSGRKSRRKPQAPKAEPAAKAAETKEES